MKVSVSVLSLAVMALAGSSGAFVPNPPGFSAVDFPVRIPQQDERCPPKCNGNASDAKRYSNLDEFSACNGTISFNYENLFDVNSHAIIACTEVEENVANVMNDFVGENVSTLMNNSVVFTAPSRCMTAVNLPKDLNLGWWGNNRPEWKDSAVAIGNEMRNYMRDGNRCNEMSSFKNQGTTFGAIWAGSMIQNNGVAATLITYLIDKISQDGMPNAKYLQWCGDGDPAKTTGIIIDASGNKEAVRQAMQQWSMGKCWNTKTGESTLSGKDLWFFDYADVKNGNPADDSNLGTCVYKTVASGDDMAIKCGITGDALKLYNPDVNLNNLQIGQILCCSAGRMPDLRPKPNPDGSCKVHTVASGDSCDVIRAKYYPLSIDELMSFNSNTYGWMGCSDGHPWTNTNICVSSGTPPRPVANVLAECGPLAPGDKYDSECPLKACCSKDGFCGIGGVHCAKVSSPTGAPGTTGCFSNCDTGYIQGPAPVSFIKVGYYESWSVGWKCMNGGFDAVDWSKYTHIHFSFADIGTDLHVKMDANATSEFDKFKQVVGSKKIVSFGGWGISTDVSTYQHLRNAMLPSNVDVTINNLISWMNVNNLDGLDIDWEYPGAPDIPSIPPGLPSDGPNYLNFLRKLKAKMPVGKSLSIAAPASYWYLKNFPIADMAPLLDYIVYMTYDLHGQWDYGNKWTGNFLKSHVDWTETYQALALITKAGVPSSKVLFGLGAYGRSFQQVDPNCSDATCRFTGPDSGATPGECTGAAGYLSLAEINKIIASASFRRHYPDNISGSDILLYGIDQWVAWTPEPAMKAREEWARSVNLGGSVIWAADLMKGEEVSYVPSCNLESWNLSSNSCTKSDIIKGLSEWRIKKQELWDTTLIGSLARFNITTKARDKIISISNKIRNISINESDYGTCYMFEYHANLVSVSTFVDNVMQLSAKVNTPEANFIVINFLNKFADNIPEALYEFIEHISSIEEKEISDSLKKFTDDLFIQAPLLATNSQDSCVIKSIHEYINEFLENQDLASPIDLISPCDGEVYIPDIGGDVSPRITTVELYQRRPSTLFLIAQFIKAVFIIHGEKENICNSINRILEIFTPRLNREYENYPKFYFNTDGNHAGTAFHAMITMLKHPWTKLGSYAGLVPSRNNAAAVVYIGENIKPKRDAISGSLYSFNKKNTPGICKAIQEPQLDEFPPQSDINNLVPITIRGHEVNGVSASGLYMSRTQNGFDGSQIGLFYSGYGLWDYKDLDIKYTMSLEPVPRLPPPSDLRRNMYLGSIDNNGVQLYRGHMRQFDRFAYGVWTLPDNMPEWRNLLDELVLPDLKGDVALFPEYAELVLETRSIFKSFVNIVNQYDTLQEVIMFAGMKLGG